MSKVSQLTMLLLRYPKKILSSPLCKPSKILQIKPPPKKVSKSTCPLFSSLISSFEISSPDVIILQRVKKQEMKLGQKM